MTATVIEREQLPALVDPVLVCAFTSQQKAGTAGTSALACLIDAWDARLVAEVQADGLYNFSRVRPQVRRSDGKAEIDWPTNYVYLATPPGSSQPFLLLIGVEPNFGWRSFAGAVADFAEKAGVRTAVSLRAVPAPVAHTLGVPVQAVFSSPALAERFGIAGSTSAAGLLDIGALISIELQDRGCDTMDVYAMEPYYVPAVPFAGSAISLIDALDQAFGLDTTMPRLEEAQRQQLRALDSLVARSEDLQTAIRGLDGPQSPATFGLGSRAEPVPDAGDLDAGRLIGDVEEWLKQNWRSLGGQAARENS